MTTASRIRPARASAPPLEESAELGEIIDGRYRVESRIGRGGMGVVYRAEQIGLRRTVAVKVLHPSLATMPELRGRFEREALAIGRIDHPNCVTVFDFGQTAAGALYLAMEYLEGETLGDLLDREERLPMARAVEITRHLLRGLEHAHAAGIVHRDVKPENVILTTHRGTPDWAKLLDFGIAKVVAGEIDDGVKLTQAGMAFGTPVYMSPEQALGNAVDGRADLYAVSVLLFEMLLGQPPFYSDDKLELLSMHTARPVPTFAEVSPSIAALLPEGLERLVRRGLSKRPEERPASAGAYLAALDAAIAEGEAAALAATAALERALSTGPVRVAPRGATGAESLMTPAGLVVLATTGSIGTPVVSPLDPTLPHGARARSLGEPVPSLRTRPWWLYGAAALGVALILVLLLVALGGDQGDATPSPAGNAVEHAEQELARGNPRAAIKALAVEGDEAARDPRAQLVLGHAYAALREDGAALAAYSNALSLDARLEADPVLRANLATLSDSRDLRAATGAHDLALGKTKDPAAIERLLAATVANDHDRRAAVLPLVDRHGLSARVDWLRVYTLDLDVGKGCEQRREAVAKLRALGDPRAIPALEAAAVRKGKAGQWKGKPINACLEEDARAAIATLQTLAGGSGSGAAP